MRHGAETIDKAAHTAHVWIKDLAERLGTEDRDQAMRLMRATLQALRDVLSHDEAAQFAAQLPLILRGVFYEGWRPSQTPVHGVDQAACLMRIDKDYDPGPDYPLASDVEEVFRLFTAHVSPGEVADVRAALRHDLRELWPA